MIDQEVSPLDKTIYKRKSTTRPRSLGRMGTPMPSSIPFPSPSGRTWKHRYNTVVVLPYPKGVNEGIRQVRNLACRLSSLFSLSPLQDLLQGKFKTFNRLKRSKAGDYDGSAFMYNDEIAFPC